MNLFEKDGEFVPDSLISGNKQGALTRGITLAPGQGVLKRGTLLSRNENNLGVIFAQSNTEGSGENVDDGAQQRVTQEKICPSGILTDDTDTGSSQEGDPVIAEEYITGVFNPNAVIASEGTNVKDLTETLRMLGIFFEEVV
jgi:hypothetical protein